MKLNIAACTLAAGVILTTATTIRPASAQGACGDPPPVANESLKGEINGKAQVVSRYLGDAQLSGKIETSRTEIFSKYPDGERANAYFEYQICVLIFSDKTMSTSEKLEELKKIRREFQKPLVKKVSIIIRPSEPIYDNEDIGDVFGKRSTVSLKVNGHIVTEHQLNQPFGSHEVVVNEGVNSFEFIASIRAENADIDTNCIGQIVVEGPASYQPLLVLKRNQGSMRRGRITGCQLKKIT